jgi:hypothetical protein
MRPYNFLRAFRIALFTNRDYFFPRAVSPARESQPTRQRSIFGRHAKELRKKPGKYCESDVVVNRLLRRASPLISGEAGVASAGLRHSYLRLGVSGSGSKAVDPEVPDEAGPRRQISSLLPSSGSREHCGSRV